MIEDHCLPIYIPAVPDSKHQDYEFPVTDVADKAVIPEPVPPKITRPAREGFSKRPGSSMGSIRFRRNLMIRRASGGSSLERFFFAVFVNLIVQAKVFLHFIERRSIFLALPQPFHHLHTAKTDLRSPDLKYAIF